MEATLPGNLTTQESKSPQGKRNLAPGAQRQALPQVTRQAPWREVTTVVTGVTGRERARAKGRGVKEKENKVRLALDLAFCHLLNVTGCLGERWVNKTHNLPCCALLVL